MRFLVRPPIAVVLLVLALVPFPLVGQGASPDPLRLRPGDAVRVVVRDEPALSGESPVDEHGDVLLPLVGVVPVGGRDFEEVRRDLGAAYARELGHEDVLVTPVLRIAVLGEVRSPGLYLVDPTYALGDLVARAGGLGPEADRDRIELVRDGRVAETVGEDELAVRTAPLRSGDQLVVARRGWVPANASALVSAGISLLVAVTTALILR